MRLKGKNTTRENMLRIIEREGQIGAKKIEDIQELKKQDKLMK